MESDFKLDCVVQAAGETGCTAAAQLLDDKSTASRPSVSLSSSPAAAFDTVDHLILHRRLDVSYGLRESAHD